MEPETVWSAALAAELHACSHFCMHTCMHDQQSPGDRSIEGLPTLTACRELLHYRFSLTQAFVASILTLFLQIWSHQSKMDRKQKAVLPR